MQAQMETQCLLWMKSSNGEVNKNLDFKGKMITVKSENGATTCFIDCECSGQGFYFHHGEGQHPCCPGKTQLILHCNGGLNCLLRP